MSTGSLRRYLGPRPARPNPAPQFEVAALRARLGQLEVEPARASRIFGVLARYEDPAEALEILVSEGLAPEAWIEGRTHFFDRLVAPGGLVWPEEIVPRLLPPRDDLGILAAAAPLVSLVEGLLAQTDHALSAWGVPAPPQDTTLWGVLELPPYLTPLYQILGDMGELHAPGAQASEATWHYLRKGPDLADWRLQPAMTLDPVQRRLVLAPQQEPVSREAYLAHLVSSLVGSAVDWQRASQAGLVVPRSLHQTEPLHLGRPFAELPDPYAPLVRVLELGLLPVLRGTWGLLRGELTWHDPRWCLLVPAWRGVEAPPILPAW